MKSIYGKDFALVYNEEWAFWGPKMWPFLRKTVKQLHPCADTWLDLCCGAGSLLQLVCRHGFTATGTDLSRHQIRHARRNAPSAKLLVQDVRALSLPGKFDVITCLFDSLNYITSKRELGAVFRRVRRHLNPNGVFAFDINTFEGLQEHWFGTFVMQAPRTTVIVESSVEPRRGLGRCIITGFVKAGRQYRRFQEEHIERGYEADEIEGLLRRAELSFRKYDCRSFGPPRKRSGRLLYVCRPSAARSRHRR